MRIEDYRSRLDVGSIADPGITPESQGFIPSIRTHHVLKYSALCQSKKGWQETACRLKPWDLDENTRSAVARHAARSYALNDTAVMLGLREFYDNEGGILLLLNGDYIRDVIGSSDESAQTFLLRTYKLYRDFLMSLEDPDKLFSLSPEPDVLCRACIGDGSGTGKHCVTPSKPWDDDQLLLRRISNSSFGIKNSGSMQIQARAFFDPDFVKLIRMQE